MDDHSLHLHESFLAVERLARVQRDDQIVYCEMTERVRLNLSSENGKVPGFGDTPVDLAFVRRFRHTYLP
jgi:hypothetical protein